MYKKLWIGLCLVVGFFSFVDAAARRLPGINIITRAQWWADESLRYSNASKTERDRLAAERRENLFETNITWYLDSQRKLYEATTATEYLISRTPEEQITHEYREMSNGRYLKWPESIHNTKNKIIIHHTAWDYTDILTWWTWAAMEQMRAIYRFHTITRGRWDIWYNFLIDPFGNIYEGRAWGEWVVWAHTSRNNTPSIGISVMGNYNENIPTEASLKALVDLNTALARKYKIDPKATVTYFKRSNDAPFLKEYTNYAIAGHTDAWVTACPGTHLYNLLPDIREKVAENVSQPLLIALPSTTSQRKPAVDRGVVLSDWYYANTTTQTFVLPIRWSGVHSCSSIDTSVIVHSCVSHDNQLSITLEKSGISGIKTFTAQTDEWAKRFSFTLIRTNDFADIASKTKQSYSNRKQIRPSTASMNKIQSKIYLSDIQSLLYTPINVLLYELSVSLPRYEVSCDGWCTIQADWTTYTSDTLIVEVSNGFIYLNVYTLEQPVAVQHLQVSSSTQWLVRVNNYWRKSYAGIPWNTFRGTLLWKKDRIRLLSSGQFVEQAVVINRLWFNDYMKGIAETSDAEHREKQKLILLLAKMYTLFYINGENPHPSLPVWWSYQAVDHPDIFQKYVGAWRESTSKVSPALLQEIQNYVILYNGYVPILPYFSCSAWFTWSAKEKRWWNDTPYLQSKLDFGACFDFNGHGVGLSGKWAQYLAEKWWTMEQIMQYYYPGVILTSY